MVISIFPHVVDLGWYSQTNLDHGLIPGISFHIDCFFFLPTSSSMRSILFRTGNIYTVSEALLPTFHILLACINVSQLYRCLDDEHEVGVMCLI